MQEINLSLSPSFVWLQGELIGSSRQPTLWAPLFHRSEPFSLSLSDDTIIPYFLNKNSCPELTGLETNSSNILFVVRLDRSIFFFNRHAIVVSTQNCTSFFCCCCYVLQSSFPVCIYRLLRASEIIDSAWPSISTADGKSQKRKFAVPLPEICKEGRLVNLGECFSFR